MKDPGRLVSEAISTTGYRYRAVVRLDAAAETVSKRVPAHVGSVEPTGAATMLKIGVDDAEWLTGYLIGLGFRFEVIDPSELRDGVMAIVERVARAHNLSVVATT